MNNETRCWKCDEPIQIHRHFQSVRVYCYTCAMAYADEVYDNRTERISDVQR